MRQKKRPNQQRSKKKKKNPGKFIYKITRAYPKMPEKKKNFECQIVIKITLYTYINFLAIIFLPYCCVYTISLNTCAEELRAPHKRKFPSPYFTILKTQPFHVYTSCIYRYICGSSRGIQRTRELILYFSTPNLATIVCNINAKHIYYIYI